MIPSPTHEERDLDRWTELHENGECGRDETRCPLCLDEMIDYWHEQEKKNVCTPISKT